MYLIITSNTIRSQCSCFLFRQLSYSFYCSIPFSEMDKDSSAVIEWNNSNRLLKPRKTIYGCRNKQSHSEELRCTYSRFHIFHPQPTKHCIIELTILMYVYKNTGNIFLKDICVMYRKFMRQDAYACYVPVVLNSP